MALHGEAAETAATLFIAVETEETDTAGVEEAASTVEPLIKDPLR